ncbi:MAG: hypothetical protein JWQ97_365 [Phenylobacterium sp.]|nr:hypothetical protein [Phenylobacterium sp.]
MSSVTIECAREAPRADRWDEIRAAVFWGFILLVIVSPAIMSAVVLLRP